MTKQYSFYISHDVIDLKNEMFEFYGNMFLEGDVEKAKEIIEATHE